MPLHPLFPTGLDLSKVPERLLGSAGVNDIVNTTTTGLLTAVTVPANYLRSGRSVELEFFGDYLNNSGAARTFSLTVMYGNSTVLWSGSSPSLAASATRRILQGRFVLGSNNGLASQKGGGQFLIGPASGSGVGDLAVTSTIHIATFTDSAVDATAELLFMVLLGHPVAHASLSARARYTQATLF